MIRSPLEPTIHRASPIGWQLVAVAIGGLLALELGVLVAAASGGLDAALGAAASIALISLELSIPLGLVLTAALLWQRSRVCWPRNGVLPVRHLDDDRAWDIVTRVHEGSPPRPAPRGPGSPRGRL